jgi:hypothetical protein
MQESDNRQIAKKPKNSQCTALVHVINHVGIICRLETETSTETNHQIPMK